MKTIGLLGGMSWESSIEYERIINTEVRRRLGGLHSADLLIRSYDFAAIEAESGRNVWSMDDAETTHAGGGEKNRMFDGVLTLPAGEYVLRYQSDGSHSYGDWNVAAPLDPLSYGVTVYSSR